MARLGDVVIYRTTEQDQQYIDEMRDITGIGCKVGGYFKRKEE